MLYTEIWQTFDKKLGVYRYPPPLTGYFFQLSFHCRLKVFCKDICGGSEIKYTIWCSSDPCRVSVQMLSPTHTRLTKIKTYLIEYQISTFICQTQSLLPQLPIVDITITATTGGALFQVKLWLFCRKLCIFCAKIKGQYSAVVPKNWQLWGMQLRTSTHICGVP